MKYSCVSSVNTAPNHFENIPHAACWILASLADENLIEINVKTKLKSIMVFRVIFAIVLYTQEATGINSSIESSCFFWRVQENGKNGEEDQSNDFILFLA